MLSNEIEIEIGNEEIQKTKPDSVELVWISNDLFMANLVYYQFR